MQTYEALAWIKVSTSHSDVSPASINVSSCATHLDAQDELINKTHQLARPRLCLSMMGLMVEVVLLKSRSKSRQKVVKKSSKKSENRQRAQKASRSKKFAKDIGSEECLPKHRSCQRRTRASVKALTVFRGLFDSFFELFLLGPRGALSIPLLNRLLIRQS